MSYGVSRFAVAIGSVAALVLGGGRPAFAQLTCDPVTLHLNRSPANQLLLVTTTPAGMPAKFTDSAPLATAGGNPWRSIGVWEASVAESGCDLETLGDLRIFIGLRNSDDQGTKFDLLAEVLVDGAPVSSGELHCVSGVTRDPDRAKELTIP